MCFAGSYRMERKRLQEEARVYLYAPKEEALVPIENIRAMRRKVRNLSNIEIANWIADQCQPRQKIRHMKITNIIMHTKKEAELQLLDDQFKMRTREAKRNITTMQQNETKAVNNNINNDMDYHSRTLPPEEEPPD